MRARADEDGGSGGSGSGRTVEEANEAGGDVGLGTLDECFRLMLQGSARVARIVLAVLDRGFDLVEGRVVAAALGDSLHDDTYG